MQQIIIEGNSARLVEITPLATAPIEALAPFLETRLPFITPILPANTSVLWYDPNTKAGAVVMESKPRVAPMRVHNKLGRGAPADADRWDARQYAVFRLALPWVYFIFSFEANHAGKENQLLSDFRILDTFIYWTNTPIATAESHVWRPQIPNTFEDSRICWGSTEGTTTSFGKRATDLVNNFFDTGFNDHVGFSYPHDYGSFTEWETASLDDPNVWMKWRNWTAVTGRRTLAQTLPELAELQRAEPQTQWLIPEAPTQFTIERARQWAQAMNERDRRIFLAAIREEIDG